MIATRTQITGLGPVEKDGARRIFDKEPKPFIATKEWLDAQGSEPEVGDYIDVAEDGTASLLKERDVSAQNVKVAEHNQELQVTVDTVLQPEAQKKTDGEQELGAGGQQPIYKYRALPVEVEAYRIVSVASEKNPDGSLNVALSNGSNVVAHPAMLSRITPNEGDYWVVQSDGYVYLNPKEVFERKYEPIAE